MTRAGRTPLAVAAFVAIAAVVVVRTLTHLNVPGQPAVARYGMHDFRDALYFPTVAYLDGRNPYDAREVMATYPVARPLAPYSPISFAVHAPFAALPFELAEVLYLAMGVLLSLAVAWLALRSCDLAAGVTQVFGVAALLLLTRPAHMTLFIGQPALLLTTATYAALLFARSRPRLAAVALAVTCLKPTWGGPLGVLMLARRDVRTVVLGWSLALVLGAALSAPVLAAAGGVEALLGSLRESYTLLELDRSAHPASSNLRLDALGFVGRLLGRSLDANPLPTALLLGLGVLACRRLHDERPASASLACLTMLTCVYHQVYDAVILTLPAVALASARLEVASGRAGARLRALLLATLAVPALNYASTATLLRSLQIDGTSWWLPVTSVNGASVLGAFLVLAVSALRHAPRAEPLERVADDMSTVIPGVR